MAQFKTVPTVVPQVKARPQVVSYNAYPTPMGGYMRDLGTPYLFGWNTVVREPVDETMEAWILAAGKAIETIHNSGFISGGIDTAVAQQVGTGLQLDLQPMEGIIGDNKATQEWAKIVERRFMAYANDPWSVDLGGRYTLGQIEAQAVRQQVATGEVVATLPFVNRVGSTHGTKINLLPSSRLSQVTDYAKGIIQGVQIDAYGAPVGYRFENRDLRSGTIGQDIEVRSRDVNGRPTVIHLLDAAPTATRGITPLVPVLRVIRQYDQLADATLTAALLQTVFAATIESDAPTKELVSALQSEEEQGETEGEVPSNFFTRFMMSRGLWYKSTNIDLGHKGKLVHLYPGEKLNFNKSENPNTGYNEFAKGLLREVARCLGITYEQLTGDFSGATYSSVRMAIADVWLITMYRRNAFPARLAQAVFEAWLEEDIERSLTPFPGGVENFLRNRQAICQCYWRGPPKPTADDLKTAKANQIARSEGWISTAQGAAEYGNDWLDVAEAQEREFKDREERGLPPLPALGSVQKAEEEPANPDNNAGRGEGAGGGEREEDE